jgi:hypothetical protein
LVEAVFAICFDWGNVSDGPEEALVVVPVDPFQGGQLDSVQTAPWPSTTDQLGLNKPMIDSAIALS